MADRKPLLVNKELYNLLNYGARKQELKDVFTSETPEKMLKNLQSIFCKGRYKPFALLQEELRMQKVSYKKEKRSKKHTAN